MLIRTLALLDTEPHLHSKLLVYEIHRVDSAKEVVEIAFKTVGAARHLTNMQETLKQARKAGFNATHLTREQKVTQRQARLNLIDEVESIQRWIYSSTQRKRKIETASNDQGNNTQRPRSHTGVDRLEDVVAEGAGLCICTGVQIVNNKVKHLCCSRPRSHAPEDDDAVLQQQDGSDDGSYDSDDSMPSLEDIRYADSGREQEEADELSSVQTRLMIHQLSSMSIANAWATNADIATLTLTEKEIRLKALFEAR
jgi:hypothetical protein